MFPAPLFHYGYLWFLRTYPTTDARRWPIRISGKCPIDKGLQPGLSGRFMFFFRLGSNFCIAGIGLRKSCIVHSLKHFLDEPLVTLSAAIYQPSTHLLAVHPGFPGGFFLAFVAPNDHAKSVLPPSNI